MTCRTSMAGCEETLHYSPKKRFMNRRLSLRFHPPKAWGVSQVLANNPTQKATDEAQVKDLMIQISRRYYIHPQVNVLTKHV